MLTKTVEMTWKGPISQFMRDQTLYLDLEGAFRSGKTTAAVWKVLTSCLEHPGINWLICRWTDDDTHAILKPVWRRALEDAGIAYRWDGEEHCDVLANGSRVYIRGLKPSQETSRYGKLRGMTLAGVYNDQTEELPYDFFLELKGRLSQRGMPHQMILTPNPEFDADFYLAKEFPESNTAPDHKYLCASIYNNAHNLEPSVIPKLEKAYPPGTAKHRPAILGKRGVKVLGKPVYQGSYRAEFHERPQVMNPSLPLLEAIDFGKHHPCVVWAQYSPWAALSVLGAVMGLDMFLEDFAPIIQRYRTEWFPHPLEVWTCCDPAGSHNNSQGVRKNGVEVLKDHGFAPRWIDNSNALDVRGAAIERIGGAMLHRTRTGEGFGVDPDRQYVVSDTEAKPVKFLSDGLEAGYVWDPHPKSVGSKPVRAPLKDGWYEHGQNCLEYLEINFGGAQPSEQQVKRHAEKVAIASVRRSQRDYDPLDRYRRSPSRGRF